METRLWTVQRITPEKIHLKNNAATKTEMVIDMNEVTFTPPLILGDIYKVIKGDKWELQSVGPSM